MNRLFVILLLISLLFALPAHAGKTLLVVGDLANSSDTRLVLAMKASGFKYDLHELRSAGPLTPEQIMSYQGGLIIRSQSAPEWQIPYLEADVLFEYLLTQGQLLLFGTQFQPEAYNTSFPGELLFDPAGPVQTNRLDGVPFDLISHEMTLAMNPGQYQSMKIRDQAETMLATPEGATIAFKAQTCSFRLVVCGFQPGDVADTTTFDRFIYKTVDWFNGNSMGIGVIAPDGGIKNLQGKEEGLYGHLPPEGTVTLVEFWATWCSTCAKQKPILAELLKEYNGRLGILAISYKEKLETVNSYLAEHPEVTWPVILDWSGVPARKYGVKALPHLVLLDGERRVHYINNFTTKATLKAEIEKLLRAEENRARARELHGR